MATEAVIIVQENLIVIIQQLSDKTIGLEL